MNHKNELLVKADSDSTGLFTDDQSFPDNQLLTQQHTKSSKQFNPKKIVQEYFEIEQDAHYPEKSDQKGDRMKDLFRSLSNIAQKRVSSSQLLSLSKPGSDGEFIEVQENLKNLPENMPAKEHYGKFNFDSGKGSFGKIKRKTRSDMREFIREQEIGELTESRMRSTNYGYQKRESKYEKIVSTDKDSPLTKPGDAHGNSQGGNGVNCDRALIENKNGFGLNKNSHNVNLKKTDFTYIDQMLVGSDFAKQRLRGGDSSPARCTVTALKNKPMSKTEMTFSKLLGSGSGGQVAAKVLTEKSGMGPDI